MELMAGLNLRRGLIGAAVLSLLVTGVIVGVPGLQLAYRSPDLHVALLTTEGLIGLLCCYLLVGRLRRRSGRADLLVCLAFGVLAASNLCFSALPAIFADDTTAFSTWSALLARLLGGVLLVAGAVVSDRPVRVTRRAWIVIGVAPIGALVLIAAGVGAAAGSLPDGVGAVVVPEASNLPQLTGHPALLAAQILRALLYGVAAVWFARRAEQTGDRMVGWIAIGCVFSAAAGLNYFLFPSLFTDYVYTGDAFRLAFYVVVLLAVATEIRQYWRQAAVAAVEAERRQMAHRLHDGVAQELAGIVRNLRMVEPRTRPVTRALECAERAIHASRQTIAAIDDAPAETLASALDRLARSLEDREGAHVVVRTDRRVELSHAQQEAFVMIASEAVTNAVRHGGADLVRIEVDGPRPVLRVHDDGGGFEPDDMEQRPGHYGLGTMRARAESIEGTLFIRSAPGRGTMVEVTV